MSRFTLLLVAIASAAPAPSAPVPEVPRDCDYLILTDTLLLPQARRLAELRASLASDLIRKPHIVTMSEIYGAFPGLSPKYRSLLAFLQEVRNSHGGLPAHLVLFGDASANDASPQNLVPTRIYTARQSTQIDWTVSSDDTFAELLDSLPRDSLAPFAAIGRIPAHTPDQARRYVDKIEAYESRFPYGPEAFTYGFAADDDRQYGELDGIRELPAHHEFVWNGLPIKPFVRRLISLEFPMDPDRKKPAARDSLISILNSGPSRFFYVGHGHHHKLSDEDLFTVPADLDRLKPRRLQPILAMLACTTAPFAIDSLVSLGEHLLFHPHGAIAFLGGVQENYPYPNNLLFRRWTQDAAAGGTLGESFRRAKASGAAYPENNRTYALLGDPGLTLRNPRHDLAAGPGSGQSRLVLQGAGGAGDSVYYQVVQEDSVPYLPLMHPDNFSLGEMKYLRETVVKEGKAILAAGGNLSLELPAVARPATAAVKVMTWNANGMRYGHLPYASLGAVAVRSGERKPGAGAAYRLVLRGNEVRIRWNGPQGTRETDLRGALR